MSELQNDRGDTVGNPCGTLGVCDVEHFEAWRSRAADVAKAIDEAIARLKALGAKYPRNPARPSAVKWVVDAVLWDQSTDLLITRIEPAVPTWVSSHFAAPGMAEMQELAESVRKGAEHLQASAPIFAAFGETPPSLNEAAGGGNPPLVKVAAVVGGALIVGAIGVGVMYLVKRNDSLSKGSDNREEDYNADGS